MAHYKCRRENKGSEGRESEELAFERDGGGGLKETKRGLNSERLNRMHVYVE